MALYEDITPLASAASLKLTHIDHALCQRIEDSEKKFATNTRLPFTGLNVSFECEFLVPPKNLSIWSKKRRLCQKGDDILATLRPAEYADIGCQIVKDRDMAVKLEGNTLPHNGGRYPGQTECIKEYFQFRKKLEEDIAVAFPDHRVQRYSEHVHFSFKDNAGNPVKNLDPRFIELLEASLTVHWQVGRPLVTAIGMLTEAQPPRFNHPYVNQIGTRLDIDSDDEINFIVRRESAENHHYEVRRTLPGPDSTVRKLPYSPMLMTHALLACSVNTALSAYSNPALATQLMAEAGKVRQHPNAYSQDVNGLIREIAKNPIFNHPDSMGSEIALALAQEISSHVNDNPGYRDMINEAKRRNRGNRR